MAKGYWVVFADVSDPEGYKEYIAANGKALSKYGARFLARGGKSEPQEGKPRSRVPVTSPSKCLEFTSSRPVNRWPSRRRKAISLASNCRLRAT